MLILTRRVGEKLYINDDIELSILLIKGGQVRLGITAPADVQIYREEIYHKIKEEQKLEADARSGKSAQKSAPGRSGKVVTSGNMDGESA